MSFPVSLDRAVCVGPRLPGMPDLPAAGSTRAEVLVVTEDPATLRALPPCAPGALVVGVVAPPSVAFWDRLRRVERDPDAPLRRLTTWLFVQGVRQLTRVDGAAPLHVVRGVAPSTS